MKLCMTARFSVKKFFWPKNLENGPKNGPKQGSLNLFKNLVINFYWICSVIKIFIVCCVPAQILYLGKYLFLRYGPKSSQPIRLQDFLINHISRTNRWNSLIFFYVDTNSHKSKVDQKISGWVWSVWSQDSKIDCTSRMNGWNELIFCMVVQIQESLKLFHWFLSGCGQKRMWPFSSQDPKIYCILRISTAWVDFFACWLWYIFLLDQHLSVYIWL